MFRLPAKRLPALGAINARGFPFRQRLAFRDYSFDCSQGFSSRALTLIGAPSSLESFSLSSGVISLRVRTRPGGRSSQSSVVRTYIDFSHNPVESEGRSVADLRNPYWVTLTLGLVFWLSRLREPSTKHEMLPRLSAAQRNSTLARSAFDVYGDRNRVVSERARGVSRRSE